MDLRDFKLQIAVIQQHYNIKINCHSGPEWDPDYAAVTQSNSSQHLLSCVTLTSAPVNFPDMLLQMVQQFKQLKWLSPKKKKKKEKCLQRTHCEVQLIPLSQSSQPVQAAALVVILEELDEA